MKRVEIGDRVAYARTFLRSIGSYAGPLPFARGHVLAVGGLGDTEGKVTPDPDGRFCEVRWENDYEQIVPALILRSNLVRVEDFGKEDR